MSLTNMAYGVNEICQILHSTFGYQNWWPVVKENQAFYRKEYRSCNRSEKDAFEIAVGAILTQNTAWKNVVSALTRLKEERTLTPLLILQLDSELLARKIKSAGYYNQKTRKLKILSEFIMHSCNGKILNLRDLPLPEIRRKLLSLWGIGPETADSILLYALGKPVFVVDAYTKRIFSRLGIIQNDYTYDKTQDFFTSVLERDVELYGECHALFVKLGKEYCRPKPLCYTCPLGCFCPLALNKS